MLNKLINLETLKLRVENLTQRQKEFSHLIEPRFFEGNKNPFRKRKTKKDYIYLTPIELEKDLFYLHPFMDPKVLEQGNVRRFPSGINKKYISEKYFEDKWVSEGNNVLSKILEEHIKKNLKKYKKQKEIRLLDIGPCGGAITTLFALRSLDKFGLVEKTKIILLDIVPNVLEATILGEFLVPDKMIREYNLKFAGKGGKNYKELLKQGVLFGIAEWYKNKENKKTRFTDRALKLNEKNKKLKKIRVEYFRGDGDTLPKKLKEVDFTLAGYVHHHMNFLGKRNLCGQMEKITKKGGFVGIVDFYVKDYEEYMKWYKPHFKKYGDAPPVECPLTGSELLKKFFKNIKLKLYKRKLYRSFLVYGKK
jgi:hypothetical protein